MQAGPPHVHLGLWAWVERARLGLDGYLCYPELAGTDEHAPGLGLGRGQQFAGSNSLSQELPFQVRA